jgi:hypothetical protein
VETAGEPATTKALRNTVTGTVTNDEKIPEVLRLLDRRAGKAPRKGVQDYARVALDRMLSLR